MEPKDLDICVKYLIDKLDPDSKDELAQLLGKETPDIAADALVHGTLAMDRLPDRIKRREIAKLKIKRQPTEAEAKAFRERFPNAARLKG